MINDLKTLNKLKEVKIEEDRTELIEDKNEDSKNENFFTSIKLRIIKLFNSIFPPKCYVCNKKFDEYETSLICDKCRQIYKQYKVDKVFYKDNKEIGIGIYRYDGVVRFLIQKMKFGKNKKIAYALAELAEEDLRKFLSKHHVNYIVPIPMHDKRLKERGFNQAEVIARILSEKTKIPIRCDLVGRTRYTTPQSKLANADKKDNVKNSFKILNEFEILGKDIILIDDIYTTGSTMEECSRVLSEHNTRRVYFLTISVSNNNLKGE